MRVEGEGRVGQGHGHGEGRVGHFARDNTALAPAVRGWGGGQSGMGGGRVV